MGIVAWVVLGAIAGYAANIIVGGREGLIGTVILGVVGGVVGGLAAADVFDRGSVNSLNAESMLIAIAGAVVVLVAGRLVASRRPGYLRF
jgi:uncharacterized membrane protein YeaQ/YmgE (transglycosylase-associated protein family)